MGGIQYNLPIEHTGNAAGPAVPSSALSGLTNNVDVRRQPGGLRRAAYYLYNTYFQYHTPFVDNKLRPRWRPCAPARWATT